MKKEYIITDKNDIAILKKIKEAEYNIPSVYGDVFYLYKKYVNPDISHYSTECSSCPRNIFSMYDVVMTFKEGQ